MNKNRKQRRTKYSKEGVYGKEIIINFVKEGNKKEVTKN